MRAIFLAAALFVGAPGLAAPPPEPVEVDIAAISEEMTAYGVWLMQLDRAQAPVQQMMEQLQAGWRGAMAAGDPREGAARFRPLIAEFTGVIDRADSALAALATPDFPTLDLAADLQPASIVRDMRETNRGLRGLIAGYDDLLDAMVERDPAAAERSSLALIRSLRLVLQTRLRLVQASQAATPREDSTWEMISVELLLVRALDRVLASWPPRGLVGDDATLSADLVAIADELERNAQAGEEKVSRELADYGISLAEAREAGDVEAAAMLQRIRETFGVSRRVLPLGVELAAILRRESRAFESGRVSMSAVARLVQAMQPIRQRLDEIAREEAAALAGAI